MPKSRVRKKTKGVRNPGPSPDPRSGVPGVLDSLRVSDWGEPATGYTVVPPSAGPPPQIIEPLHDAFAIRVGQYTIRWESWPQCVAATRAGTRCLQPAIPENPGPFRAGAYLVEARETYGSRSAEQFRRLTTQRCHLHDNATPDAVAFEGQVSAGGEAWLAELQQAATHDAIRAEHTRKANLEKLTDTECPTCGVAGSLKCVQTSGKTKPKGYHLPRLQAAFGQTNHGQPPIV